MSGRKFAASILFSLLALSVAGPVIGQIAPRLTGEMVITGLQAVQHDLATRAQELPQSSLAVTSERLAGLTDALRQSLDNDASMPVDLMDSDNQAEVYRAAAVAARTRAYLDASKGCRDADANAMAEALAETVKLAVAGASSAKLQPVIDAVETTDHRSLFVLRSGGKDVTFALVGRNLFDAQCENPTVTATNGQGESRSVQPVITGVLPTRIELQLPGASKLEPGSYVLHVVAQRKAFLVGCRAQPEALAVLQVAAAPKVSVSYGLTATCRAATGRSGSDKVLPPITGTMPESVDNDAVPENVTIVGCDDPISYALTAKVTFADGKSTSVGPFSQISTAGITAGLPGGQILRWDPFVRQLFLRPSVSRCKGVY